MQPEIKETTIAYAARLREMAHDGCNFGSMCDERILEHLIQTIEDSALIQKCISKSGTLQGFLIAARQTADISTQMHDMKPIYWNKDIYKVRHIHQFDRSRLVLRSGPIRSFSQDRSCYW